MRKLALTFCKSYIHTCIPSKFGWYLTQSYYNFQLFHAISESQLVLYTNTFDKWIISNEFVLINILIKIKLTQNNNNKKQSAHLHVPTDESHDDKRVVKRCNAVQRHKAWRVVKGEAKRGDLHAIKLPQMCWRRWHKKFTIASAISSRQRETYAVGNISIDSNIYTRCVVRI